MRRSKQQHKHDDNKSLILQQPKAVSLLDSIILRPLNCSTNAKLVGGVASGWAGASVPSLKSIIKQPARSMASMSLDAKNRSHRSA